MMQAQDTEVRDLTSLYNSELQPILGQLEQKRLQVRNRALVSLALIVPLAALLGALLAYWFGIFGLIIALIAGIFGWFVYNRKAQQRYREFFKTEIIARLARLIDPNLTYHYGSGISIDEFRHSGLFRTQIDRYQAEDFFSGQVGATAFRFSEVHAEYKTTTTDSKGNTQTHWHTIFQGIFFISDFNKHFQGRTYVLPDIAERTLGIIGQVLQEWGSRMDASKGELIKLEDPEFEQFFAVRSTDQVEARYILSTSLMQRLTEFRRQLNTNLSIAFIDSSIFIAISTSKNHFEPPSLWRGSATLLKEDVEAYFKDVRLAEQIVEDLNLNLRIWSKQ
jgi:hypothetical protein